MSEDKVTWSAGEFPIPTFHCDKCGQTTEGFTLCLRCNPQTYEVSFDKMQNQNKLISKEFNKIEIKNCPVEIANDIWNAAIEAAAIEVDKADNWLHGDKIRKLKK